jgi:hypothetical protein
VDDVYDAGRVEDVNNLKPQTGASLTADDEPIALMIRVGPQGVVDDIFGLRGGDAMPGDVFDVPPVPPEYIPHEILYNKSSSARPTFAEQSLYLSYDWQGLPAQ